MYMYVHWQNIEKNDTKRLKLILKVIIFTLLLILITTLYIVSLNTLLLGRKLQLSPGWEDQAFSQNQWKLSSNNSNVNLFSINGVLSIAGLGKLSSGTVAIAQRFDDMSFDLNTYSIINVYIKTNSINVAARIVIWTDDSTNHTVLLKTYNDNEWHNEIIDTHYFGASGSQLYMIELCLVQVNSESNSIVSYKQLSFNELIGIG